MKKLANKRLLFVVTKSNWGGAQQYVYTLATEAKKAGATVAVVLGGTGKAGAPVGALAERLKKAGIRTIFLSSLARDMGGSSELNTMRDILRVIRIEKPDVLHVNSSKAGGIGALAGRLAGVPHIIFTAHGWPHKEPRNFFTCTLIWLASYATVLFSHIVIVLSQTQYEESPALFLRHRLVIIPNGVPNFPLLDRQRARTKLAAIDPRIATYATLIMSTSELHKNKGVDVLIEAFDRVAQSHPDTALVLTHTGEERVALIARVAALHLSDRVFFLDFVPEVRSLLAAADLFVLPSRKEGLPFGLLEAGRAGVPVIATTVGAIPEVIENNISGILVPSGNILALTAALKRLLDDSAYAQTLGKALQKNIEAHFSEARMVLETFALYR